MLSGRVEDEGVSTDDIGVRSAGISTGLSLDWGAGIATGGKGPEKFRMPGPGLSLVPPSKIATSGDEEAEDSHGQDEGDAH